MIKLENNNNIGLYENNNNIALGLYDLTEKASSFNFSSFNRTKGIRKQLVWTELIELKF